MKCASDRLGSAQRLAQQAVDILWAVKTLINEERNYATDVSYHQLWDAEECAYGAWKDASGALRYLERALGELDE